MTAFYNERDPYAAEWLRNLIAAGHIAPGVVSEEDIRDLRPIDLMGYTQCHFFAGIGVWSYALRRAGWPDDEPIWTGSCPCQPFSAAGRRAGVADERHLWPHWFWLIDQCRPPIVLGEQVASKDGLGWLDLVSADMEGAGYAFGASDLCAAGFGGAHIRQRLYFVGLADAPMCGREPREGDGGIRGQDVGARQPTFERGAVCPTGGLADADVSGFLDGFNREERRQAETVTECSRLGGVSDSFDGAEQREEPRTVERFLSQSDGTLSAFSGGTGPTNGFWRASDWLFCRDGKWRPVEPGTQPLAHAAPARVGRLRAYGNALDKETAENFVGCVRFILAHPLPALKAELPDQIDMFP